MKFKNNKTVLVTGSAGFIGFSVCRKLVEKGWNVIGLDSLSDYYDVSLKLKREKVLLQYDSFRLVRGKVEEPGLLASIFQKEKPSLVIHLAAQAGVRYSLDNPRSYLDSNITGTFELLEAARANPPKHILLASTSSAYGATDKIPFKEYQKADHQMSFYAATKKATENMAHSYSHLFELPITVCRFFTVYGPWGRPDMALFKFTKAILEGEAIDVYNHGDMQRDFTFIDDLIRALYLLIEVKPEKVEKNVVDFDSISPVAPYRVVNIGNSNPTKLGDFIEAIETALGMKAVRNEMPMQQGDVPTSWASSELIHSLTGYEPKTDIKSGIKLFVDWYREFYRV